MILDNIYNIDSFQGFGDSMGSALKTEFKDAFAGAVLSRNLTHVDPKIFEKKYPQHAFVNCGIQANNAGGYAANIDSLRVLGLGSFAEAGVESANAGKISITSETSQLQVRQKKAFAEWTRTDIEQAKLQNLNFVNKQIEVVNQIYLQEIDEIGLTGIGSQTGLLNDAGFASGAAAGVVTALTAQQAYDEVADLLVAQFDGVNNTPEYMANKVIMPLRVMNNLNKVMLNTAAGSSTVLTALRDNFPGVEFIASWRAESVSGTSRTVAFSTNEQASVFRLPVPLQIGEAVKTGSFSFEAQYMYRAAGLDVLESLSGQILTGL